MLSQAGVSVLAQANKLSGDAKVLAEKGNGQMQRMVSAMKEIGDRLDGKVTQLVGGDPDAPLVSKVIYEVVGASG